ncbi:hypothetical protein [Rhodococcus qingshengii]|uniref:hypothetical protein n=1 Tax=Rhodococcus qingshengii TaxID=334542 RepID=UPI0029438F37|nr:hypothetical protein [Rhodococcus qingshengii]WOI85952.1 hypothetical protein R0122_22495 [Rhodococcus qingshengii]
MTERQVNKQDQAPRYRTPRDEVLHSMADNGWANESAGDVASSHGWFARISNEPADIHELSQVFDVDIYRTGIDPQALVGHYLLVETSEQVTVIPYATEVAVRDEYRKLLDGYYQSVEDEL